MPRPKESSPTHDEMKQIVQRTKRNSNSQGDAPLRFDLELELTQTLHDSKDPTELSSDELNSRQDGSVNTEKFERAEGSPGQRRGRDERCAFGPVLVTAGFFFRDMAAGDGETCFGYR